MDHWYPGTTGSVGERAPTSGLVGELKDGLPSKRPTLADCGRLEEASQGSGAVVERPEANRASYWPYRGTGLRVGSLCLIPPADGVAVR